MSSETRHTVCAIVSKEPFLRTEALTSLLGELGASDDALGPTIVEGSKADLAEVLDEVRTPSLLGDARTVVVDDADGFVSQNRAALERYCSDPSPCGVLVLLLSSMPKTTKLYKIVAKTGRIIACDPPKGRAMAAWLGQRASTVHGKQLSPTAAQVLREHIGDDVGRLDAELGKLAAYVGDRPAITPEDVHTLTGNSREAKVFAIVDALASGDTSSALEQWRQVLATDRAAPARAIAGLAWAIRRLLAARIEWSKGGNLGVIARRLFTDAGVLERRFRRLSAAALERQLADLLAADLAVKTGASSIDVAIEKFLVKHSGWGKDRPGPHRGNAA